MVIKEEELYLILKKEEPTDEEIVQVLAKYILDRKNEDTSSVGINLPKTGQEVMLMFHMYGMAKSYYLDGK